MKSVNLMCPINWTGYGVCSFNILNSLVEAGVDVSLFPLYLDVETVSKMPMKVRHNVERGVANAQHFNPLSPTLRIWHQFALAESVGHGDRLALTFFETNALKKNEVRHLESVDVVFVSSEWARQVVLSQTKHCSGDVVFLPMGVDRSVFGDVQPVPKDKFVFLNVGKWEVRKGHQELIQAFSRLRAKHEDVELWMVPDNPFLTEQERRKWCQLYTHEGVKLFPKFQTQQELSHLMGMADVGVFPSKAEAWNMEGLEMLSKGRPIIISDCTAHKEYCTPENAHLLTDLTEEPAVDGKWFHGVGTWNKVSIEELYFAMETAYNKGRTYNAAGVLTAKEFSWKNTVEVLMEYL